MSITSRINEMSTHIEQAYDELQGLGADLTNVNKNIENISMVLDDIYDSMPQVSGEGTNLTLDDTRVGKIKSTLKGNTSQTGTPTPSSPIPVNVVSGDNEINVCGKNLLNMSGSVTYQGTSINFVGSEMIFSKTGQGGISAGPRTQLIPYYANQGDIFTFSGNYLSGTINLGGSQDYRVYVYPVDVNGDTSASYKHQINLSKSSATPSASASYTLPYDIIGFEVGAYFPGETNTTTGNVTIGLQLEKGSTASTYEPYQGNAYNIDLGGLGKNKFDINSITKGIELNSNTGQTQVNSSWWTSAFIPIKSNQAYTSSNISSNSKCWYDNNKNFISYVQSQTATSPANAKYLRVNGTLASLESNPQAQIEEGSSATTFEAYIGIELCKIGNYQDYFYKDSGKWYLHKEIGKVVLNGSTNRFTQIFSTNTSGINRYRTNEIPIKLQTSGQIANVYCDKLIPKTLVNTYGRVQGISVSDAITMFIIYIDDIGTYTLEQANNWLSTNNLKIYYVLATPTNTEEEYQPLIDQLNLLEKAMSKDGQTNISQVNNDLPFIISASALKEWSV